jgi:shikimate kinase
MLGKPFIDTDTYICETTGRDPAEHFAGISDTDALALEIDLIRNINQKNGVIALS